MKTTLLVLCFGLVATAGTFAQGQLQIVITNLKNTKGTIRVGLFATEETFLKNASQGKVVKIAGNQVTVEFESLVAGDYGISVFHDENENEELDKNFIGMPNEGFAFGNNSMGTFGPPDFDKAKIRVEDKKTTSQTISLKYL